MKIDQIAFGCMNQAVWERFAAKAAAIDQVTFSGVIRKGSTFSPIEKQIAFLAFDYEGEIEREYLFYKDRLQSFHNVISDYRDIFLSHLASHCDSIDLFLSQHGRDDLVMDVITVEHKNEKLNALGRKYRYAIFDWRNSHGYFYKLIQRIDPPASTNPV